MFTPYLLWSGDILVALRAVRLCRLPPAPRRPRTLLAAGLALFSVASLLFLLLGAVLSLPEIPEEVIQEIEAEWAPAASELDAEIAAYRGGWSEQQPQRVEHSLGAHLSAFPAVLFWFCSGLMLIGMALYHWGVLSAERSDAFYTRLAVVGLLTGAPLIGFGIWWNFAGGWTWERSMFFGVQFNYWGAVPMALGYLGLVMLAVRRGFLPGLQARLAAVGRMAFTNYLLQTVICTTIFYGHGLGLIGSVERYQQLLIVFAVWALQLWLSPIWMRRYSYGPFEWLWRALTYRQTP